MRAIALLATMILMSGCEDRHDDDGHKVQLMGTFEAYGATTKAFEVGRCHVYVTKWESNPNPNVYFSCPGNKTNHPH